MQKQRLKWLNKNGLLIVIGNKVNFVGGNPLEQSQINERHLRNKWTLLNSRGQ